MKVLYLPLKKEWYEMIESGEKKAEYRILSCHWICRLLRQGDGSKINRTESLLYAFDAAIITNRLRIKFFKFADYDAVRFSYGYTQRTMTYRIKKISVGRGRPKWGAPVGKDVFIIKLGGRIE